MQVFPKRSYQSYHGHIFSALTSLTSTSTAKENLFLSPCHGSVDTQRSHSRCHCGRHPAANLVRQRSVVSVTCKEPRLGSAWFALCATVHCRSFMSLCILCEFYIVVDSDRFCLFHPFPAFPQPFPQIHWVMRKFRDTLGAAGSTTGHVSRTELVIRAKNPVTERLEATRHFFSLS